MRKLIAGMRDNRGIALIIVLMVISVLTILVLDLHQSVRINFYIASNLIEGIKASYLARSGIQVAAGALLKDVQENNVDSWHEDWYDFLAKAGMPGIPIAEGEMVLMEIHDESGRFNLNGLVNKRGSVNQRNLDVFKQLLIAEEIEIEVANAVVDWIDENNEALGGGGVEDQAYGYGSNVDDMMSKNSRFESLQEVRLVHGVTDEVWSKLEPLVTIYGDAALNLNTTNTKVIKAVMKAIDENADTTVADKIEEWRRQSGGEEGEGGEDESGFGFQSGEGNVFKGKNMATRLMELGMPRATARKFVRYFGSSSHFFRVTVTALVHGVQKNAVGIIFRHKKKVRIIYYRVAPGVSSEHMRKYNEQAQSGNTPQPDAGGGMMNALGFQ
ncbi:MAG: type II secretion system minor pseudopilin GspK [Candidatus Lernaella stagnicola]|nr:type II secretion system minor pseudopilin GspK [Candidatus Lernaella stagnicola]